MKNQTINIFSFNELSEKVQTKVIEKVRYNFEVDLDYLIDNFNLELSIEGFYDSKIYYTGFYSQDDGLSFDAKINMSFFCETENEKRILNLINNGLIENLTIDKNSFYNRYYHEKTRYTDFYKTGKNNIDTVLNELCNKIENKRLELCYKFYGILEDENDYFYSDENIKNILIENNYEFFESGKYFNH
jgi:hypothetical protein